MRLCVLVARITIETGSVESVCIICRMDVVARVDRHFNSFTIWRFSTFFLTGYDGCVERVLKAIVSLYRAGEEKRIERYKTRVKVAEENELFSSFQKNIIEFPWAQRASLKVRLGIIWPEILSPDENQWQSRDYAISTQPQLELELPFLLGSDGKRAKR